MISIPTIAVLLTCHNRRDKTLQCLTALYHQAGLAESYTIAVFLVDDASTDGTTDAIKTNFPEVNIIQGNGNLFWNRGMRLAWETAAAAKDYDFYLWLNDDTFLNTQAINHLFECFRENKDINGAERLIVGACKNNEDSEQFSYGGRTEAGPVIPNGKLQRCKYINGNAVLIPKKIYQELGNLSNDYTHGMGDFDFGLRASKAGFSCYTTKNYVATCPTNLGNPSWCDPTVAFKKRWNSFHSPRGLNIKEYNIFRQRFWGSKWLLFSMKAYFKLIFPHFYKSIKK